MINSKSFEEFEIHPSFYKKALPKHGVTLRKTKEIYSKTEKISGITKRRAKNGYQYAIIYEFKNEAVYLCFLLDEKPPKFFNAYLDPKKRHKRVFKKFNRWLNKQLSRKRPKG